MKQFTGTVLSTKMKQTITVKVDRLWQHPIYKKRVKRSKKYLVHDEIGAKTGDKIIFQETKPISKNKRWKVIEIVKK